jgi:hypothetical protein
MIGRAAINPVPDALRTRLASPLEQVGVALSEYLRASGTALEAGRQPPSLTAVDRALDAYATGVAAVRQEGLTRSLPGDAAERFFAVGFALEQMHNNLKDLARCVSERAGPSKDAVRKNLQPG